MVLPITPKSRPDPIEQIKQYLSAKWGPQFPVRDLGLSPSSRNPNAIEEKVHNYIRFLYFARPPAEGALDYAIADFEKEAPTIISEWQFKARAEMGVIPTRKATESALGRDFLRRRQDLDQTQSKHLIARLESVLSEVSERVKNGQAFPSQDGKNSAPREAKSPRPAMQKSSSENPPGKKSSSQRTLPRQQAISNFFGPDAKSTTLSASTSGIAYHASSDDYPDDEINTILGNTPMPDAGSELQGIQRPQTRKASKRSTSEHFETPPTSPARESRLGISMRTVFETTDPEDPSMPPPVGYKRFRTEPETDAQPRKVSRESSEHIFARNIIQMDGSEPASDHQANVGEKLTAFPKLEGTQFQQRPLTTSRSLENLGSVSSSMTASFTSTLSAFTSPNTSFSRNASSTSIESNADDTDTTARIFQDRAEDHSLRSASARYPSSESLIPKNQSVDDNAGVIPMDIDNEVTATNMTTFGSIDPASAVKSSTSMIESSAGKSGPDFASRLTALSPFLAHPLVESATVPFRQVYEVVRVATFSNVDMNAFSAYLTNINVDDYLLLWKSLGAIVHDHGGTLPDRSSILAWNVAGKDFSGVSISGKLTYLDSPKGSVFQLRLLPLKMEATYRLSRKFGTDRFFVVAIPGLGSDSLPAYLKCRALSAREAIVDWLLNGEHKMLGRTWRAFFVRPEGTKKGQKTRIKSDKHRFRLYLFAENGMGFREGRKPTGEVEPRRPDRPSMKVEDMLEWFMPFKLNQSQACLKFFARLALGLSSTTPTIEFTALQVFRTENAHADMPGERRLKKNRQPQSKRTIGKKQAFDPIVMNDGCARISKAAAADIAKELNLDYVPSVFQGRLGGAKGLWMVDTLDEQPFIHSQDRPTWIEITKSQSKFTVHQNDLMPNSEPLRLTFEVNNFSKPLASSYLNYQLMPILQDRGVPADVFRWMLQKDLGTRVSQLEVAMDDGLALRKWNQINNPVVGERMRAGGIEMQGGLPSGKAERVNWFVDHGFEPKKCEYLKKQLYKIILAYCQRLENKMNIGLGLSTVAYMIADPLNVLAENEVHICFSNSFKDPESGFDQTMLHEISILVARSPALLPSDIQKVKAVFKPDLRFYRDVIVFSSRGQVSLASKLSGGDYDGDTAWICWEPSIVEPFVNAEVPEFPSVASFGIEKDTMKVADVLQAPNYIDLFLKHSFHFNLQANMLGTCTNYREAMCYIENSIQCPHANEIAVLLGLLVDSAKGGFKFDESKWVAYLKKHRLKQRLNSPAYRNKATSKPKDNLIDDLVFRVARNVREDAMSKFYHHFKDTATWDDQLVQIRNAEVEEAKSDSSLDRAIRHILASVQNIHGFWELHIRTDDDEEEQRFGKIRKATDLSFASVIIKCREDFLAITPYADPTAKELASPQVQRWIRQQENGQSGYWELLKASVAFHRWHKSTFIWHMAGIELGEIKAMACGRGTYRPVVHGILEAFKVDGKVVDRIRKRKEEGDGNFEGEMEGVMEGLGDGGWEGDGEDEFGEWGWEDAF